MQITLQPLAIISAAALLSSAFFSSTISTPAALALEAASEITGESDSPAPTIAWQPCPANARQLAGLQCGMMQAPLDHFDPSKGTINVALAKRPAAKPQQRKGTVFINPGGPGNSARDRVNHYVADLGPEVTDSWDIVGVDPRGVGGTEPLTCTMPAELAASRDSFSWNDAMHDAALRDTFTRNALCAKQVQRIGEYMSTADTARDMDLARIAVGDEKLTYYGYSYGTVLGPTYAALFGKNVRAMITDSVVDPTIWYGAPTDPAATFQERLGAPEATARALDAALDACEQAGPRGCPTAKTIRTDLSRVLEHLQRQPLVLPAGQGASLELRYDKLHFFLGAAVNQPQYLNQIFSIVAEAAAALPGGSSQAGHTAPAVKQLADALSDESLAAIGSAIDATRASTDAATATRPLGLHGVLCTEPPHPQDLTALPARANAAQVNTPGFGPLWVWHARECANWPYQAKHGLRGVPQLTEAPPMLILQNEIDPATPRDGAYALQRATSKSVVVEVRGGIGHGALTRNRCVQKVTADYVNTGQVPTQVPNCPAVENFPVKP